jgi:hypothetical protein
MFMYISVSSIEQEAESDPKADVLETWKAGGNTKFSGVEWEESR